ncbi:MAG TPA: DinB family protein [Candidatus Eisenbacteria bacterium]
MPAPARPDRSEVPEYYHRYVVLVPDGDIVRTLRSQIEETWRLLGALPEERAGFRYGPEKWSVKEVVGHLSDSERVFAYRCLRFARADQTPLPGFEQDDYVVNGGFDARTLRDLLEEFGAVREATIRLASSLDQEAGARRGTASERVVSARGLLYIIAGHELHHRRVLVERYLA